jgi:hypothetical protein
MTSFPAYKQFNIGRQQKETGLRIFSIENAVKTAVDASNWLAHSPFERSLSIVKHHLLAL